MLSWLKHSCCRFGTQLFKGFQKLFEGGSLLPLPLHSTRLATRLPTDIASPTALLAPHTHEIVGLRWRSGQSARLSPLRLRVRFSVRTFSMLLEPSAPLMRKESVNTPSKVVGFLWTLPFPLTGKLTGWVRINTVNHIVSNQIFLSRFCRFVPMHHRIILRSVCRR